MPIPPPPAIDQVLRAEAVHADHLAAILRRKATRGEGDLWRVIGALQAVATACRDTAGKLTAAGPLHPPHLRNGGSR